MWRAIVFECELHWAELYIVDRCSGRIKFVPMKSSLVVRSSKLRHLSVMTLSYAIFLCESDWWVCCQFKSISPNCQTVEPSELPWFCR